MTSAIPIIDVADYLTGRPGMLQVLARQPQFDQVNECLPTCTDPGNPPRRGAITYAAWQEYWYDANYDPEAQKDMVA